MVKTDIAIKTTDLFGEASAPLLNPRNLAGFVKVPTQIEVAGDAAGAGTVIGLIEVPAKHAMALTGLQIINSNAGAGLLFHRIGMAEVTKATPPLIADYVAATHKTEWVQPLASGGAVSNMFPAENDALFYIDNAGGTVSKWFVFAVSGNVLGAPCNPITEFFHVDPTVLDEVHA